MPHRLLPRPLLALLLLLAACAAPPLHRVPPVLPRERHVDILDYEIQIDLDHEAGHVEGQVAIEFTALPGPPVRSLVLDAVDLDVHAVWDSQGRELATDVNARTIEVHLAEPLRAGKSEVVSLQYDCYPRRGIYIIPPNPHDPDERWCIWTQGQTEETRYWMPVRDLTDDRATHTLRLTVDDDFVTMAAGTRTDSFRNRRTGRRTDTWRMDVPHVPYLITFVTGGLAVGEQDDGPVPLPVLAEPDDMARALANTRETGAILRFFGELTGRPYPYPKYAQTFVPDFTAGGMENISATTLYEESLHDPADEPQADCVDLLAHEAAHQWFGDLITCRDWSQLWLNEGFADYLDLLYTRQSDGPAAFGERLLQFQRAAVRAEDDHSRPIVWSGYDDPDEMFDDHSYNAAASRLHLLRTQIGDEAFLAGLRAYVSAHAEGLVTTDDLVAAMETAAGRDLDPFFDEWFRGVGYPVIDVHVEAGDATDTAPRLVVEQLQGEQHDWREVFHAEVGVTWSRGGVEHEAPLGLTARSTDLRLAGNGILDWVRFDAGQALPARVRTHQSEGMWTSQLTGASDPVARLLAAQWLAGDQDVGVPGDQRPDPPRGRTLAALLQAARSDPFVGVRTAALAALTGIQDEQGKQALAALATDPDPRVREAAVAALGAHLSDDVIPVLTTAAEDENASVVVAAVRGLLDGGFPGAFPLLERLVARTDRVRLARNLVDLSLDGDDPDLLPFLLGVARTHPERWVRARAISALGVFSVGPTRETVFRELCQALQDDSYQVREAAAGALAIFGDRRAVTHLEARADIEADPSVLDAIEGALARLS